MLLTYKALSGIGALNQVRTEQLNFVFPGAHFHGSHYRAMLYAQQEEPISLEHSAFYRSLNPAHATNIEEVFPDPDAPLIGNIGLDTLRNYNEFAENDKKYVTLLGMEDIIARWTGILIKVCMFEQDPLGDINRRIESTYDMSKELASLLQTPEDVVRALRFDSVQITERGSKRWMPFSDGAVRNNIIECYAKVLNAYQRGLDYSSPK